MRGAGTVLLAALLAPAAAVGAAPRPVPLEHHLAVDLSVTVGAGLTALLIPTLAEPPSSCRLCGEGGLDASVRRALVWGDAKAASDLSDVAAYGVAAVGLLGGLALSAWAAGEPEAALVDALVVAEAASLSLALNQAVKYLAARERPYARNGRELPWVSADQRYLSFYSGHTSLAFAAAAAAGTVAFRRGYPAAWALTGGGLLVAALTGYLRIAADMHYLTDVLTGAIVGSAVGFAVAWFLHPPKEPGAAAPVSVTAGGIAFRF